MLMYMYSNALSTLTSSFNFLSTGVVMIIQKSTLVVSDRVPSGRDGARQHAAEVPTAAPSEVLRCTHFTARRVHRPFRQESLPPEERSEGRSYKIIERRFCLYIWRKIIE